MVSTVQTSTTAVSDANQQKLKDFNDKKITLSKKDLQSEVLSALANGEEPSNTLVDIIDSYDKIDTNGDGIGYDELNAYKKSKAGILASLGLSATSAKKQNTLLDLGLLDDSKSTNSSSLLDFLKSSSSNNSKNISKSLIESLSNYSSTNTSSSTLGSYATLRAKTNESIIDYLT